MSANKILAKVGRNSVDTFLFQLTEFKGKKYIDIRTFYTDDNGDLQPTKKGINIPAGVFPAFLAALERAKEELVNSGVFDKEEFDAEFIKQYNE